MDDPVHGRRAAIFATERKRLPPSFYWGAAVALALHIGGAAYLLQQHFVNTLPESVPGPVQPPTLISMEPPPKTDTPKQQNVVHVHAPPPLTQTVETTQLIPQPKSDTIDKPLGPPVISTVPAGPGPQIIADPAPTPAAPRWSRFPDAETLTEYYPPRAIEAEVEGQATVQCVVLDAAGRVSCVAVAEIPGGFGFGAATARMVQERGRVDTSHGDVPKGTILRQTVSWRLN